MKYVKLRPVKSRRHIARVKTRFAKHIEELEELGFQEVDIYYDFAPPYYFIGSVFDLILKYIVKDEWVWAWPFTYATLCSLRYHPATGTYVNTYGLGSIFYNEGSDDGSLYISASWGGTDMANEPLKIFKHYAMAPDACGLNILKDLKDEAARPSSLAVHVNRHLNWVRTQREVVPKEGGSLEDFSRISMVELLALHPDA